MSPWIELHRAHLAMQTSCGSSMTDIRRRLGQAASRGHIRQTIQGRFTYQANGGRKQWGIRPEGRSRTEGAELLEGLREGIREACLTVNAITDADRLEELALSIEGRNDDGVPFAMAVHLTAHPEGAGACGHALLHCHVGSSLDDKPKVRVPMPALGPVEVLDWMLTVVLLGWEPAPWERVRAELVRRAAQQDR